MSYDTCPEIKDTSRVGR